MIPKVAHTHTHTRLPEGRRFFSITLRSRQVEGEVGREKKKDKEERKGKKVFPATTQASKDTPKEERRRVPSYDESKEGKKRKEKRERGKREGRGQVFPATNKRPGTHQGEG